MAGGSRFILILGFFCIFEASDNRNVHHGTTVIKHKGSLDVDDILSKIPITLPDGIDPSHINVTSITLKTCSGLEEQLMWMKKQLQETTVRNNKLNEEFFKLMVNTRVLKTQLATCSATASAVAGSYHTQLSNKMKQLLETFDTDTFLILKMIVLNREIKTLEKKISVATNSTADATGIAVLQNELQNKMNELNRKKEQLKGSHTDSAMILQIIELQNQIWDLEQEESRRGEAGQQQQQRITVLQEQLNRTISELRRRGDSSSVVLELISVQSKIAATQKLIHIHIKKSKDNVADYQRQLKQKSDLLKKKILLLNRDENNVELTQEILILQAEVMRLRQLTMNSKTIIDSQLQVLKDIVEEAKKQQEILEKQLEGMDYAQSQLILRIISMMEEVRELQSDEKQTTSTSQGTTLEAVLQAKDREYAKAQAEIKELQEKLQEKSKECSGLEERYKNVKTEFEEKIAELNRTGDSNTALILTVINLHNELNTLKDLISTTKDPDAISDLQRQVEEKQTELNSKNEDIQRLITNPQIVLTIIKLQNEIHDLQSKPSNETTSNRIKYLQQRVDGFLTEIDDRSNENTKQLLKIVTLQNQVQRLQQQLSELEGLRDSEIKQLRNDLVTKKEELQGFVDELHQKNQTNARLIIEVTELQVQLRNLEEERRNDTLVSSLTITELQDKLRAKMAAQSRDQAEIKTLKNLLQDKESERASAQEKVTELQKNLQEKSKECSGLEERYKNVKTEFEEKIAELNRTGDSNTALILTVINLHNELNTLKDLISTTKDPDAISDLQRQVEEKQTELNSKNEDIQRLITNPQIVLEIIELQNKIWDLQQNATDGTASNRVKELQTRLDNLISGVNDKGNENTKLMLKILTLQSQVDQLQRQLSKLQSVKNILVNQLERDLTTKENELQKNVDELNEKKNTNAELILSVTNLNNQLRKLQEAKRKESQTASARITDLEKKLNETEAQCSNYEQQLIDVQNDLDDKIKELQSGSDSITSLTLQISTLTLQLEELKQQLQTTNSKAKIKELEKQIEEKDKELAKLTEQLKMRSSQPQRLLQIISLQTEIEKYVNVATNESDYLKIQALEDHLKYLIEGIQDNEDENTKLVIKVLAQRDKIERLQKIKDSETKAATQKIKDLENELETIRKQIEEKTRVMDSSGARVANLSAQIMELHSRIKPLKDEISDLKEEYAERLAELQRRLDLSKLQLQDSELRLRDAESKKFDLIMEIADLRGQLKKAQKTASRASRKNVHELENQLEKLQNENKKLEAANKDLEQEVQELTTCCNDELTQCDDLQKQLKESHDLIDHLGEQLAEKEKTIKNHQLPTDLETQLPQHCDQVSELQQQLREKDLLLSQLQQDFDDLTVEKNNLQEQNRNLQNEKNKLEDTVQELQDKINDVEDKTIRPKKMTFDPNTAHPRIILSAQDTKMSTSDQPQDVPDNPGRYNVLLAALSKTGFSGGRNYWEISVAEKICFHLGMASESANRRGAVSFNPGQGYWTIILNKQGIYRALDTRHSVIQVQTQPLTIGVLLDYNKGQISFYDSGARSHMYTFSGQVFFDKMYPFVNFCVEEAGNPSPLTFLTPGSVDWIK